MTARRDVMEKVKQYWGEVRSGSYFVHRGALHWPSFDFSAHPRAVSIGVDDATLFREMNEATISFEIGVKMPLSSNIADLDDSVADEITDDIEWVLRKLIASTNSRGDNIILKCNLHSARVIEWSDAEIRVQGAVLLVDVSY